MDGLTGRPELLKQANLSLIRGVLRARGTATRAEIVEETRISTTTVRSLLTELLEGGEIVPAGHDESSGGRKAERYRFVPERYYGAAFCVLDGKACALLVDLCGAIVERTPLEVADGDHEGAITAYLDQLVRRRELRAIGVGVPGVVDGKSYWRKRRDDEELYRTDLGEALERRYGLPVVLENDLKATAVGFGRCYAQEFPGEDLANSHMAYLHFEKGCVSAGFLVGGRVLRGSNDFAGELGLVPMEGETLVDDCMAEPMDDGTYVRRMIQIIGWVCGVLNPQYVALSGADLRKDCIGPIGDGLSALLPRHMQPELLYAPDVWGDYCDGMAHLTAERMFEQVQLIKE